LLSNVVNGMQDPSEIFLNSLGWYEENKVRLHAGVKAVNIDRVAKRVLGAGGVLESYDKLVIATGSSAFIPPIANVEGQSGGLRPGGVASRTLEDCHATGAQAAKSKRAAVIGGGLLGLEAARGLLSHGCEVHVIPLSPHLMNQQLDPPGSA